MIRTIKPKTARGKRALKEREPKVFENVKSALFLKSNKTSQIVNTALTDFALLKKPYAVNFSRKNDIHPFDDELPLEFFCTKNDTSLFMVGSHSKKRPHTLTIGRTFDGHVLDMVELHLNNYRAMSEFESKACGVGKKPLFVFSGDRFENSPKHQLLKSLFLDFYRGQQLTEVALTGLEHVIALTAVNDEYISFRVYSVQLKKSASTTPRVELVDMGQFCDMKIGRVKDHDDSSYREAMKIPKEAKAKKIKNIGKDSVGDKFGRIHVGQQDIEKLQTRKMKGLKRGGSNDSEDDTAKKQINE